MREAPTAVPGSKPKSAAASWVRPSPKGLPGGHVTLPAWQKTAQLQQKMRGPKSNVHAFLKFLRGLFISVVYLFWKSCFPADPPVQC